MGGRLGRQDLDRHGRSEHLVHGLVHGTEAPLAQQPLDAVLAAEDLARQVVGDHRRVLQHVRGQGALDDFGERVQRMERAHDRQRPPGRLALVDEARVGPIAQHRSQLVEALSVGQEHRLAADPVRVRRVGKRDMGLREDLHDLDVGTPALARASAHDAHRGQLVGHAGPLLGRTSGRVGQGGVESMLEQEVDRRARAGRGQRSLQEPLLGLAEEGRGQLGRQLRIRAVAGSGQTPQQGLQSFDSSRQGLSRCPPTDAPERGADIVGRAAGISCPARGRRCPPAAPAAAGRPDRAGTPPASRSASSRRRTTAPRRAGAGGRRRRRCAARSSPGSAR